MKQPPVVPKTFRRPGSRGYASTATAYRFTRRCKSEELASHDR